MPDIFHDFPIAAPPDRVFHALTTPQGLDQWWTKRSAGTPVTGEEYVLWFGPEHDWRARVSRAIPDRAFELEMVKADSDWTGTRIGFELESGAGATLMRFRHSGWPVLNEHFRTSAFCWAMYLRILKRHLEHGEAVPYERRLEA